MNERPNNYSRERFLSLLTEVYQAYEKDGYYYFPGSSQERIADELACDPATLTRQLNPEYDRSYKNLIKRLESVKELQDLRNSVTENKEKAESQKREIEIEKRNSKTLIITLAGLSIVLFCSIIWGMRQNNNRDALMAANDSGFLIRERSELTNIMNWHGELMVYRLAWEATILNAELKISTDSMTEKQRIQLLEKAQGVIKTAMREGRDGLSDIGFVNLEGINLGEFIEKTASREKLFSPEDTLFTDAFNKVIPYLLNKNTDLVRLKKEIEEASASVREKQWDMVWEMGW